MTDIRLRQGPSGPPIDFSNPLNPPATLLGRALSAVGVDYAEPLDGPESGLIARFSGYGPVALAAGTQENVPVPDGTRLLDVTPAGVVTLTSVVMSARGNNSFFILRKRGVSSSLSIPSNQASNPANRFFTPAASLFNLDSESDAVLVDWINTRWQPVRRLLNPYGANPSGSGAPGLPFAIRATYSSAGGGPTDTVIATALPANTLVYDVLLQVSVAIAATTAEVRTALGGGGAAASSPLSTATTGTRRNNATSLVTAALGAPLVLRRTVSTTAGTVIVFCKPAP